MSAARTSNLDFVVFIIIQNLSRGCVGPDDKFATLVKMVCGKMSFSQ